MSHPFTFLTAFSPASSGCAYVCGKRLPTTRFSPEQITARQITARQIHGKQVQAGQFPLGRFLARLSPVRRFAARQIGLFLLLTMTLLLSMPAKGNAAPPKRFEIQTFSLVTTDNMLTVDLALTVDDEEGLYNLLKDGAVVELGIDIEVERKRDWWSNASIASLRYTSVIRHDPLTREFFLTMPSGIPPSAQTLSQDPPQADATEMPGKTLTLKDRNLTRLLSNSWQKLRLPLIPLSLIELEGHNQTYVISGSAALNHIETPPWLAQNSVFWSAEIIPSVTFSLEYFYQ